MDPGLQSALESLSAAIDKRDAANGEPVTPLFATKRIDAQLSLALTYWEDGAPFSAARCLASAAAIALSHGVAVNKELETSDGS